MGPQVVRPPARHIRSAKLDSLQVRPDFAFINCHLAEQSIGETAPASYARTLLHLRWVSQRTAILGSHALQAFEAAELPLHSMKSTMLANAAQILMAREHRMSQGHHRDSGLLYSGNDTFSSLHVQRTVADAVADGFRPERSMARGAQALLPEPPFPVATHRPPKQIPHCDLQAGEWVIFTSRHEAMHSKVQTEDSSSVPTESTSPAQQPDIGPETHGSDSDADAVKHWAEHHRDSDSDTDSEHRKAEEAPTMYVCSGPWSALRRATQESTDAYFQDRSRSAQTLKSRCGCAIGIAALAVWTAKPGDACRRKGCA